jgi:hypothetical protein
MNNPAHEADVQEYIDEIVKPTIDDLERSPTSRRLTFLAHVALFHTVDYLASRPGSVNRENLRNQFRQENQDFAIVDRVAHAFKHVEAGHEASQNNQPLHSQSVFSRPPARAGVMQAGLSYCGDAVGGVEIGNERGRDLLGVAKRALDFVCAKI